MSRKLLIMKLLKVVNGVALSFAILSIQTTCVWVHHQPKIPAELKGKREE